MTSADSSLLALHGLRLTGLAEAGAVAELTGADPTRLEVELKALADDDLVVRRDRHPRSGWLLSDAGRARAAELVAAELDQSGARPALEALYQRFCGLNPQVLALCSAWQLRDPAAGVVNDHRDVAYDRSVVEQLAKLDQQAQPLAAEAGALLERFNHYGRRLAFALERVQAGETDFVTRPLIASYHTVWFELHEDLLTTLGLDRASETARLSRSTIGAPPS